MPFKRDQMCIEHNKECLLHLLQEVSCDGWCLSADPCDELLLKVSKCDMCGERADPFNVYPFYDGAKFHLITKNKREIEVDEKEVTNYATNKDSIIEYDVNKKCNY